MKGLIRASLNNVHAVVVFSLTLVVLGSLTTYNLIPVDILPVFKSPAVQVLTFYGGMPAEGIEKDITNRMERWTGQSNGMKRQESRSIVGASIVRNYFYDDVDPNGALTQVNSLALGVVPNLPPGTLPPVVLPFDPTSTVPVCMVALDSTKGGPDAKGETESILYDVGRYEVRNMIMSNPGASAPVVFGGKIRAVMVYVDRTKMQARDLSPMDVMDAVEKYNVFIPAGDVKIGSSDIALLSNSLYDFVESKPGQPGMEMMPLVAKHGKFQYLKDVAEPKDAAYIQTNIVRIGDAQHEARKEVYIPVYRQQGASTLDVVDTLAKALPEMNARLSGDRSQTIDLKLVMDQSVYVRASIKALVQEGLLGSLLCSLTILLFLGEWRMTLIAILTLPISVLSAVVCLHYTGNTINVMTLAGLTLAIGPMVDSAIICLENTHRHLSRGATPRAAALTGASEVAMPELVSTLCTFLVLAPLALMPGAGRFLFQPMTFAVAFSMITAYILSRTLVPSFSALLLKGHTHDEQGRKVESRKAIARAFARWEALIDRGIGLYVRSLNFVLRWRRTTIFVGFAMLAAVLAVFYPIIRRDFFPEVDSGAFEMILRGPTGLRIDGENGNEGLVAKAEQLVRENISEHDLELIISELGVTADWSAAYTPNAGPMDTIMRVQLKEHRERSAQEYVSQLRGAFAADKRFAECEFAFDSGGLVRGALNEGKSTPINVRITGKDPKVVHQVAERVRGAAKRIDGIVDARVVQKLDYPAYVIEVDRAKAADAELTQDDIMRNVIASTNSSISFNKRNFWIDPIAHNQYFVGVQFKETAIHSKSDLENIPITGRNHGEPVVLKNLARIVETTVPSEINHLNIQSTIDVTMGVERRDLGHVCDELAVALNEFGKVKEVDVSPLAKWIREATGVKDFAKPKTTGVWSPYDPNAKPGADERATLTGSEIVLSGEYSRMQDTFRNLSIGLVLASLLIYFLMVGLDKSFVVPLAVMLVVPLCLIGIIPMLYLTGSAVNVQSLLGFIFIVGIKVANTVLMTDFAQEIRRHEGLSPIEAIAKAAGARVRPITMTALAAFFAMIPTAMALERGSEANAPLARAILGGLLAGEPATLFVLPCLYAVLVRDRGGKTLKQVEEEKYGPIEEGHPGA
jgi:multidrug efflux pump subunit AcrB